MKQTAIIQTIIIFLVFNNILFAQQEFRKRANQLKVEYDMNDVKAEIEFGRSLAARILGKYPLLNNKEILNYVAKLGSAVAAQIGRPELKFYFAVLETEDINAYACPGGYIFITKGALRMMENEAQLIGVIGHEINHVNERHVIKKLKIKGSGDSLVAGFGNLIGGSTASFRMAMKVALDQGMELLFGDGISQDEELHSDAIAIQTLASLGYNSNSYLTLISKLPLMIKHGRGEVVSKTHPSTDKRLRIISRFITKYSPDNDKNLKINISRFKNYVQL